MTTRLLHLISVHNCDTVKAVKWIFIVSLVIKTIDVYDRYARFVRFFSFYSIDKYLLQTLSRAHLSNNSLFGMA